MSFGKIVNFILSVLGLLFFGLPLFLSGLGCTVYVGFTTLRELFEKNLGAAIAISSFPILALSVFFMALGFGITRLLGERIAALFKKDSINE